MKLNKRQVILIKQETTQGTPVTPSASTDAVPVLGDITCEIVPDFQKRDQRRASLDTQGAVIGGRWWHIHFTTEYKGSGTRGDATIAGYAGLDAALQACAQTSASVASTSITYAPTSSAASANYVGPGKSVTIEVYKDGQKSIAAGCLGTFKISLEAGKFGSIEFDFWGVYAEPTDVSIPTITDAGPTPPVWMGATVTLMTVAALVIRKFELDLAGTVAIRRDAQAATSVKGMVFTGREPKGTITIEAETVAVFNALNKLVGNTQASTAVSIGATSGNIVTLTMAKFQLTAVKETVEDELLLWALEFQANVNSGDDWLSWVTT